MFSCLAFLNFFVFMVHTSLVGGSPGNGKIENGKFYLGEHGHYTEVSRSTFERDKIYEFASGIAFLIGLFIQLDLALSKRK